MIHDIDAIYDQGVFRPIQPIGLPEGARVHLRIEEQTQADRAGAKSIEKDRPADEPPTLLERLKDVVGVIEDLPEDSSVNLDRYLYGTGKR